MKTGISDYLTRWRHTHGYGVHSPLAYRITKDCLHPDSRYAMYADDYIDSVYSESDFAARRMAYLLLRLVNIMLPSCIWMPGADRRIEEAIKKSFNSIHINRSSKCPKNADFIAIFNNTNLELAWNSLHQADSICLISFSGNQSLTSSVNNEPTLSIVGRRYSIFIKRKGMAPVSYSIL